MAEELIIPEGGNYLRGDFVKENNITEVEISNAKNVEFERSDGKKETKVQVKIKYEGQKEGDPDTWTMNNTSARALAEYFGSTNPNAWTGKIPIESAPSEKGRAIYADKDNLKKYEQKNL